jgi:hypothetical protein
MSKRDEYQRRIGEELALWSARFEALRAYVGPRPRPGTARQLERWQAAEAVATSQLTRLKATQGDAWDAVKEDVEEAWRVIEAVRSEGVPARAAARGPRGDGLCARRGARSPRGQGRKRALRG